MIFEVNHNVTNLECFHTSRKKDLTWKGGINFPHNLCALKQFKPINWLSGAVVTRCSEISVWSMFVKYMVLNLDRM